MIRSSPIGGDFFLAAVKSFDASVAISGNFVLNAKNSIAITLISFTTDTFFTQ